MAEPNVELRGPVVPQDGVPDGQLPAGPEPKVELPGTLGSRRPPLLNVLLFILTGLSAFFMGVDLRDTALPSGWSLLRLVDGLAFAGALIAILLAHEMGHFLLARRHGVDATWPFFIPAPLLSLIGTLGAVMKLRSLPRTRKALIDIAVAGPVAGFVVTLPVLAVGLWLSPLVPAEVVKHWTLAHALESVLTGHGWLPFKPGVFDLGQPLAMRLIQLLVRGELPAGQVLAYHPVAIAGWFGLLLTALNLLPAGQLDGGHLLYGCSPRWHRILASPVSGVLLGLGIFGSFTGWLLWAVITGFIFNFHPPLAEPEERLTPGRKLWLLSGVVMLVLSFTMSPVMLIVE